MRITNLLLVLLLSFISQVDLTAQDWPVKEWPVATPQSQSMNPDSLKAFDDAIASGKYGLIDGCFYWMEYWRSLIKSYRSIEKIGKCCFR